MGLVAFLSGCSLVPTGPADMDAEAEKGWRWIETPGFWETQFGGELAPYNGFAWYRCFFQVPKEWKGEGLLLTTGGIHDADEVFFNGLRVGSQGSMPPEKVESDLRPRHYGIVSKNVMPGRWNLLAVRVFNAEGLGGITEWDGDSYTAPLTLSCDKGWLNLAGRWQFRKGDDLLWAKWPFRSRSSRAQQLAEEFSLRSGLTREQIVARQNRLKKDEGEEEPEWGYRSGNDPNWKHLPSRAEIEEAKRKGVNISPTILAAASDSDGMSTVTVPGVLEDLILSASSPESEGLRLWYERPALDWVQALPVGNGRLGGMVFGRVRRERIALNLDTLWSGRLTDGNYPDAIFHLKNVRKLLAEGRYREAQSLAEKMFNPLLWGRTPQVYQPLGDLRIESHGLQEVQDYWRELDLDEAMARVHFRVGNARFLRETFVSVADQALVVRYSCDQPGRISFVTGLDSPHEHKTRATTFDTLVMGGINSRYNGLAGNMPFETHLRVRIERGAVYAEGNRLVVRGADAATLYLTAHGSHESFQKASSDPALKCRGNLQQASERPFEELRENHLAEHQRLFGRVSLSLGRSSTQGETTPEMAAKATNLRLENVRSKGLESDPKLAELLFQYGRYLLMSSSRPGSQPANGLGLWNESMAPPEGGGYSLDGHTQMNYWPALLTNLAECQEPFLIAVAELADRGRVTARIHYDSQGWVAHRFTDFWRATAPLGNPETGLWPCGGAWLCRQIWDYYAFTQNTNYLQVAYPIMKGAAQFFLDSLVKDAQGRLVVSPSISPGSRFPTLYGPVALTDRSVVDIQIVRDLFENCLRASEVLAGLDSKSKGSSEAYDVVEEETFRRRLREGLGRLARPQIGSQGELREYLDLDFPGEGPGIFHLFGLYPGSAITLRGSAQLAQAARKSLELKGDEAPGWSRAWKISLWARLENGQRAFESLSRLIAKDSLPNLFNSNPFFQIDGNFGLTAGVAEMLLQSHQGCASPGAGEKIALLSPPPYSEIHLLPALPPAWPSGRVKGLRARGGFEIDIEWENSKIAVATIRAGKGGLCRLRAPNPLSLSETPFLSEAKQITPLVLELRFQPGQSMRLRGDLTAAAQANSLQQ